MKRLVAFAFALTFLAVPILGGGRAIAEQEMTFDIFGTTPSQFPAGNSSVLTRVQIDRAPVITSVTCAGLPPDREAGASLLVYSLGLDALGNLKMRPVASLTFFSGGSRGPETHVQVRAPADLHVVASQGPIQSGPGWISICVSVTIISFAGDRDWDILTVAMTHRSTWSSASILLQRAAYGAVRFPWNETSVSHMLGEEEWNGPSAGVASRSLAGASLATGGHFEFTVSNGLFGMVGTSIEAEGPVVAAVIDDSGRVVAIGEAAGGPDPAVIHPDAPWRPGQFAGTPGTYWIVRAASSAHVPVRAIWTDAPLPPGVTPPGHELPKAP